MRYERISDVKKNKGLRVRRLNASYEKKIRAALLSVLVSIIIRLRAAPSPAMPRSWPLAGPLPSSARGAAPPTRVCSPGKRIWRGFPLPGCLPRILECGAAIACVWAFFAPQSLWGLGSEAGDWRGALCENPGPADLVGRLCGSLRQTEFFIIDFFFITEACCCM